MKENRTNTVMTAAVFILMALLTVGLGGCGDSSSKSNTTVTLSPDEAYATLLEAHVKKQTAMYEIISALSNGYQNGLLAQPVTESQLDIIEYRAFEMEALAADVIAAQTELTQSESTTASLRRTELFASGGPVSVWNGSSSGNPILRFFSNLMGYSEKRRNEFLTVVSGIPAYEQKEIYQQLPPNLKEMATDPYDFYKKIESGDLDDAISAIIASARNHEGYIIVAQEKHLTRGDVIVSTGLRMIKDGVEVMTEVYKGGGDGVGMVKDLVKDAVKENLKSAYDDFVSNKHVVFGSASGSAPTAVEIETAVETAIDNVNDVIDVTDADTGDIVTGDANDFEIDPAGQLEETPVSANEFMDALVEAFIVLDVHKSTYTPLDSIPAAQGIAVVTHEDGSDMSGVVAAERMATADLPAWIIGLGASGSGWSGALPSGIWEFTPISADGTTASAVSTLVNAGAVATVLVDTPPPPPKTESPDHGGHDETWFDWVEYVDEYGLPFGDNDDGSSSSGGDHNVSCDGRSLPDGACVDYFGMNDTSRNNMANGCDGVFSDTVLCDMTGVSFSCMMDVSVPGDSYQMQFHVYNAGSMPAESRTAFCNSTCDAFEWGDISISNCRVN